MIQTIKYGTTQALGSVPARASLPESPQAPQGDELLVSDQADVAPGVSSPDKSAGSVFATPAGLHCAEVGLERQIDDVIRRLQNDFPHIDPSAIRRLLDEALGQTRDARVRQFRSLLAERTVRDHLRSCSTPSLPNAGR